ncbi:MAG: helix-turn-helix domain-containing protein [Patescibacteria group bacterium]
MNENDIYAILKGLGFVGSEVKTYLASLEHGPATVIELTKMTKLSRQATYVVIDSLTARGLMSSLIKGKKRYYVSEDPEKLLAYSRRHDLEMEERLRDLERVMPELKLKQSGDRPVVKLYEGKEGIFTILEDLITSKPKVFYEITDLDSIKNILRSEDLIEQRRRMKKAGISGKGIISGETEGEIVDAQRCFLPKDDAGFKADILVYNNKVAFLSCVGKLPLVVIESEVIAQTMRILFNHAFKELGK